MALINGTNAHPAAATVGIVGGIALMPFAVAGTAVVGALGTVALAVPTLGLGAIPGALVTAGATVGSVFVSPFSLGSKIYNKLVPSEDEISFISPIMEEAFNELPRTVMNSVGDVFNTDFREVINM